MNAKNAPAKLMFVLNGKDGINVTNLQKTLVIKYNEASDEYEVQVYDVNVKYPQTAKLLKQFKAYCDELVSLVNKELLKGYDCQIPELTWG